MARSATSSSRTSSRNFASLAYGPVLGRTGAGGFGLGVKVLRAVEAETPEATPLPLATFLAVAEAVPPADFCVAFFDAAAAVAFLGAVAAAVFFAGGAV